MNREQMIKNGLTEWYWCVMKNRAYDHAGVGKYMTFWIGYDGYLEWAMVDSKEEQPEYLRDKTHITTINLDNIDTSKQAFDVDGVVDYQFPDPDAYDKVEAWVSDFVDEFKKEK